MNKYVLVIIFIYFLSLILTNLMKEAASTVMTRNAEQMMLEMVQDRIETGVTRVV
jgi:hypothetical protein